MNTEWYKDDNGYIWLFQATNISIRPIISKTQFFPGTMTKTEYMKLEKTKHKDRERVKDTLIHELNNFEQ